MEASTATENGGTNADQATIDVDERAARVPGIDRGIGLDKVFITLNVGKDSDVAALGADNSARDRFADTKGIPDGQHAVAHLNLRCVGKGNGREAFRVDLDDGDVGLFIPTDHLGGKLAAIGQCHSDDVSAIDHVVVGRDVAVLANNHARTDSASRDQAHFRSATLTIEARKSGGRCGELSSRDLRGDLHNSGRNALYDIGKGGAFLFFLFAAYWLRISLQSDCRIGVLCSLQSGQGASHHEDGPYSFPGFKYTSSGYVHE